MNRVGMALVGAAGLAVATAAIWMSAGAGPFPWWVVVPEDEVGALFLGLGLLVWLRRPVVGRRMALLLVAVAVAWYLPYLQFSANPVLFRLGFWLFYLHIAVLAQVLFAAPHGRLARPAEQWLVAGVYASVLVTQGMRVLTEHPLVAQGWGSPAAKVSLWAPLGSVLGLALTAVALALVVQRWRAEPALARRVHGLLWAGYCVVAVVLSANFAGAVLRVSVRTSGILLLCYAIALMLLGGTAAVVALRTDVSIQRIVARLLAQLDLSSASRVPLHKALAEALKDPSLTLHYWSAGGREYLDPRGESAPPWAWPGRAVTIVKGPDQQPLAAIGHDPYLLTQPHYRQLLDAVVAASGLALDNARLDAENQAHLRGLLEAEHATRRSLQALLHDGVQHRLTDIQFLLGQARDACEDSGVHASLTRIADEVQATARDLRDVVAGIYPVNLRDAGLAAALDRLADLPRSAALELRVASGRWPPPVEETAYFVVSEAVGNAHKHAKATRICVDVETTQDGVLVRVSDDGVGGATFGGRGTGLRGLRDRVAAGGGTLEILPSAVGTTIEAVLPCA